MSQRSLLILVGVAEAVVIITALLLALFVFPDEKGGLNLKIFLPAVLVSSSLASGVIVMAVQKNKR